MVHVGAVRQTAQITWMSTEALRTGDKAIVNFKFVKAPEWIQAGRRFVFREGRTKAVSNDFCSPKMFQYCISLNLTPVENLYKLRNCD